MYIPSIPPARQLLAARSAGMSGSTAAGIWVAIAVAGAILTVAFIVTMVRRLRIREAEPRLLPGRYMKNLWWKWTPRSRGGFNRSRQMTTNTSNANISSSAGLVSNNNDTSTANPPQRGQSIRSIITLPSYSRLPKEEEQVIAREGEREGMDMVVEFPETNEEEEDRREAEMESLYQIRLRRREELAEREERRRLRREARAAGDTARLQQLSRDSLASREASTTRPSASVMLAEHQNRGRHQRISSVTYADIGHVRHDGSRIRANSSDSDQRPLLDLTRQSTQSILTLQSQARTSLSRISTLSASLHSGDDDAPQGESAIEDGDLSTAHIPPPSYDYDDWGDAPAYESPIARTRGEAEHSLLAQTLPQIRIDTASPANSTLVSPAAVADPSFHQPGSDMPENTSHAANGASRSSS